MNIIFNTRWIALSAVAFAALFALLSSQTLIASEFRQTAIKLVHFDVDPANATRIEVASANGDIIITGNDTDKVVVAAEIHVNGRKSEVCEELAGRVSIEAVRNGTLLEIDPDLPRKFGYNISISYTILIPSRLGVSLETANGELAVYNSKGNVSADATNGSILLESVSGDVEASSVNGSIFLSKLIAKKIVAETINGRIDCECISNAPHSIEISTVNGSIEVTLPRGANASLSAGTVNGGLSIDTGQGQITSKSRGNIDMSIGDGSGSYKFSSVNGSIGVVVSTPAD